MNDESRNNPIQNNPIQNDQSQIDPPRNDDRPATKALARPQSRPRFWTARRRHTWRVVAATGVASVVATLLVGWVTILVMRYRESRDRVSIIARADEAGAALWLTSPTNGFGVAQTLPTQQPMSVAAGEYRVHMTGKGRFSESHDAALSTGETLEWSLRLNDQLAMPSLEVSRTWTTLTLNGATFIAILGSDGIQLFDGRSPAATWSLTLAPPPESVRQHVPEFDWRWPISSMGGWSELYDARPWLVGLPFDLNQDGRQDLLCAARHQAWVLAISGADGKLLWSIGRGSAIRPFEPKANHIEHLGPVESANLHPPQVIRDLDGDGMPEILATMGELSQSSRNYGTGQVAPVRRYVECLSGATGESLWQRPLDDALFEIPAVAQKEREEGEKGEEEGDESEDAALENQRIPVAWRWFVGMPSSSSSYGGASTFFGNGRFVREDFNMVDRDDSHAYRPSPIRVLGGESAPQGVLVAGQQVIGIDLKTGERRDAVELPLRPYGREHWADVDGDGDEDLVYLAAAPSTGRASQRADILVAWSPAKKSTLWSHKLSARVPVHLNWRAIPARWPLLEDLDGDGAVEVLTPDGTSRALPPGRQSMPFGELAAWDGKTGARRWTALIPTADQQVDHFVAGPDINGDGHREVYAVTHSDMELNLYLDVLSGRDGKRLWSKQLPVAGLNEPRWPEEFLLPPRWWSAHGDGWPQLVIATGSTDSGDEPLRHFLVSAGTGRIERLGVGIDELEMADVNGDSVDDLLTFSAKNGSRHGGGTLASVRGSAAMPWSRIGDGPVDVADFDGDGVRDFVTGRQDGEALTARSGATGRVVWQAPLGSGWDGHPIRRYGVGLAKGMFVDQFHVSPVPTAGVTANDDEGNVSADLDGDGVLDFLVWSGHKADWSSSAWPVLMAISGRSGRMLWQSRDVTSQRGSGLFGIRVVDLDGDGTSEILMAAEIAWLPPPSQSQLSGNQKLWWLFALDGSTGRIHWARPLFPESSLVSRSGSAIVNVWTSIDDGTSWNYNEAYPIPTFDLNADGVLDCIVPAQTESTWQLEYQAVSGRDGAKLWRHTLPKSSGYREATGHLAAPVIVAHNRRPEVFITEIGNVDPSNQSHLGVRWTALDGRDGARLWTKGGAPQGAEGQPLAAAASSLAEDPFAATIGFNGFSFVTSLAARPHPVRIDSQRIQFLGCLSLANGRIHPFVINPDGEVRISKISLEHPQMLIVDVDGDGRDEVAFVQENELHVAPPDKLDQPLWKRRVEFSMHGRHTNRMESFVPARVGRPAELRVRNVAVDGALVGLDARTGVERWRATGPSAHDELDWETCLDVEPSTKAGDRPANTGDRPPLVAFYRRPVTHVSRGARVGELASRTAAAPAEKAAPPLPERAPPRTTDDMPPGGDPRWQRPMPWNDLNESLSNSGWVEITLTLATYAALGLTLVVLPIGYVGRSVLRRQWSLRSLFVLPFLAGLALTVWRSTDLLGPIEKPIAALLSAPPVLAALWLGNWTVRRQWRRLRNWTVTLGLSTLLVAGLYGGAKIWLDRTEVPLIPGEYYGWDGWYNVLLPALYLMTWIMMLTVAANRVWRRFRQPKPSK